LSRTQGNLTQNSGQLQNTAATLEDMTSRQRETETALRSTEAQLTETEQALETMTQRQQETATALENAAAERANTENALADAQAQLADAQAQLAEMNAKQTEAAEALAAAQAALEAANAARAEAENAQAQAEAGKSEAEGAKATAEAAYGEAAAALEAAKAELDQKTADLDAANAALQEAQESLVTVNAELTDARLTMEILAARQAETEAALMGAQASLAALENPEEVDYTEKTVGGYTYAVVNGWTNEKADESSVYTYYGSSFAAAVLQPLEAQSSIMLSDFMLDTTYGIILESMTSSVNGEGVNSSIFKINGRDAIRGEYTLLGHPVELVLYYHPGEKAMLSFFYVQMDEDAAMRTRVMERAIAHMGHLPMEAEAPEAAEDTPLEMTVPEAPMTDEDAATEAPVAQEAPAEGEATQEATAESPEGTEAAPAEETAPETQETAPEAAPEGEAPAA
ncbi:MAG: hypothetical protein IJ174_09825, partial [Clostridia bacterium]|nr:hypothetical protein [Clostridia bacterium]